MKASAAPGGVLLICEPHVVYFFSLVRLCGWLLQLDQGHAPCRFERQVLSCRWQMTKLYDDDGKYMNLDQIKCKFVFHFRNQLHTCRVPRHMNDFRRPWAQNDA